MIEFTLTLHWKSSPSVTANKIFKTNSVNRAWGFAHKWASNAVAICGKNELGEVCDGWTIERVNTRDLTKELA